MALPYAEPAERRPKSSLHQETDRDGLRQLRMAMDRIETNGRNQSTGLPPSNSHVQGEQRSSTQK